MLQDKEHIMNDKQHNNEEQNIDELVLKYQAGDEEAGEELLRIYGGDPRKKELSLYLGKFYKMLRFGKFDFKDYDSRVFLSLFMEDISTGKALRQSYQYRPVKQATIRKLSVIVESLKVLEDEDLKQDLRVLLLTQAMRYKKEDRVFGAYLYHSYRFAVKNYIKKLQKPAEPYIHMPRELMRIADDRLKDNDADIEIKDYLFAQAPMIFMDEEIGNSWVRGLTCGEEFKELTPLQRMIIKLNYHDGMTDGKIADMMGIHINTIFRQRKKADKIVKATVERLVEEGYYK
jgi:RNA polymerase sigma factor (sigma-70 family)